MEKVQRDNRRTNVKKEIITQDTIESYNFTDIIIQAAKTTTGLKEKKDHTKRKITHRNLTKRTTKKMMGQGMR